MTIDDMRVDKKNAIRHLFQHKEVTSIEFVNGRDDESFFNAVNKWRIVVHDYFTRAEIAIFLSTLNCMEYGAENDGIIVFEDDAILVNDFQQRFERYIQQLPNDFDLFVIWNAPNQSYDYDHVIGFDELGVPKYDQGHPHPNYFDFGQPDICRAYNGYGAVAMYWSKSGCEKFIEIARTKGMFSTPDCMIYLATHMNLLNAYSLKPTLPMLVEHDFNAPSTRAGSERIRL